MPAPSARRLAAGAAVATTAVFGVLALRVRSGDDPALGTAKAATPPPAAGGGATQQVDPGFDPYGTQSEPYGANGSGGGYDYNYGGGSDSGAGGAPQDDGAGSVAPPVTRAS